MHLVTFSSQNGPQLGVLDGGRVLDLSGDPHLAGEDVISLIQRGQAGRDRVSAMAAAAAATEWLPVETVTLLAPIPVPPRNIICVGKNYYAHAKEFHQSGFDASPAKVEIPDHPVIFTKATTSVVGTGDPIEASADPLDSVDYEGELAVVIGTCGRAIPAASAFDHVFGYTLINDVTSRELQKRHKQWFIGKSIDTFCPMGPCIATADEIEDVEKLRIVTRVNGEVRQDALVKDLIFSIPVLIETLSSVITLKPGDIIATGTPAGVGIGFDPPKFLKPGDHVSITIDGIGTLENPVV